MLAVLDAIVTVRTLSLLQNTVMIMMHDNDSQQSTEPREDVVCATSGFIIVKRGGASLSQADAAGIIRHQAQ
jgi:hypothetical protein